MNWIEFLWVFSTICSLIQDVSYSTWEEIHLLIILKDNHLVQRVRYVMYYWSGYMIANVQAEPG